MTGLGLLLLAALRRDRLVLLLWVLAVAGLWAAVLGGLGAAFDDEARRGLVALLAAQPAILLLRGAPAGISLGAVMFVSTYAYLAVMVGFMMTFFAVRHSRGDEDAGRAELVRGTAVGRWAPLTATLLAGAIELALVCGATLAVSIALGLPGEGSTLLALALAGVGVLAMLVGLLAGQVFPTSRAANGAAAIVVGLWFFVRGVGDALGEPSADLTRVEAAWPVWLSPIGWGAQAHPFADAPWEPDGTPLLLHAAAALVLLALVVALESRRELGRSLLRERSGRATARAALGWAPGGAPLGLTARLLRGSAVAWLVVGAVIGALAGRMAPVVADALGDNPVLVRIVSSIGDEGGGDIEATFISGMAGMIAVIACAAAMQSVLRLRHEELAHGELLLATPVRRLGWLGSHALAGVVAGLLPLTAFTLIAAALLGASGDDRWQQLAVIALTHLPLVAIYLAVAAALVAFLPGTVAWLGWVLLIGLLLVGDFAPLLGDAWEWLESLSPFHWVANALEDEPDWTGTWWLLAIAAALLAAAAIRFRRRDALV
ncbi:ABC transporter permease [Agrococcus carbonis]|uniref:ABC-2 type transport system permease protein n=1 Tax=Agrococcus carbonis TaxID=684552 RepID=A0A1H1P2U4_9MICO|nr:ABC transporter permease [Agrococcus carbonis]SDS05512.1 ABC-2 type transport system permease protein [Agrococcus carbonis]